MGSFEKKIRPFLIGFIVLPISVFLTIYGMILEYLKEKERAKLSNQDKLKLHQEKIQRVINQIISVKNDSSVSLRTDRLSSDSHSVRIANKGNSIKVQLKDFDQILSLDVSKLTVKVEPNVTVGRITSFLISNGLQLEATLEMEDATLGGLVLSQGMTTHSHVCGLVSDTVESYEIITGEGKQINTTPNTKLHDSIPFSHGSLGFLVGIELRVCKASEYVKVKYSIVSTTLLGTEYFKALTERNPFFIEAIIFSKTKSVLIEGNLLNDKKEEKQHKINEQGKFWKEWYFKRVERAMDGEIEIMPMRDYLMRHDRSMCMTMETVFPIGNQPWFRYCFGWTLPPKISFLKASHTSTTRESSLRDQVYQDVAFPIENFQRVFEFVDAKFEIYPLLCYACKLTNKNGMLKGPSGFYLNFGIYGVPKAIKMQENEEQRSFPTIHTVRELENLIREVNGFQHTYCDTFQTEEEFQNMFNHDLLNSMRKEVCSENLPTVYSKVKPEIDINRCLEEEKLFLKKME